MAIRLTEPPRMIPDLSAAVNYLWEIFNALKTQFIEPFNTIAAAGQISTTYGEDLSGVTALSQSITNPPTQAEVQNIQAKVNEVIAALDGRCVQVVDVTELKDKINEVVAAFEEDS
ncbi:hypothetical protein CMI37_08900 [Candidatus Pacearchaeota archaeon]|nr:hypothetical protein [Candidatus Pacearchaeota archaeon]|tara:strand:- start:770 stop:1117 length:348 start_codon:yes stop_codon:yes gene_type:complete